MGRIVDASIINAPSSTKNKDKKRVPEMHQTRKGNQWYFGMKAHIGVDSKTKMIHSVVATAANVHGSRVPEDLLQGEGPVYGVIRLIRGRNSCCVSMRRKLKTLRSTRVGAHYHPYQRLMAHWKQVINLPLLEVSYDQLVSDQVMITRQILEFCELEWNENCLQFHKVDRNVLTSSYDQVRQSLYTRSAGRWRNYEQYINKLREGLQHGY